MRMALEERGCSPRRPIKYITRDVAPRPDSTAAPKRRSTRGASFVIGPCHRGSRSRCRRSPSARRSCIFSRGTETSGSRCHATRSSGPRAPIPAKTVVDNFMKGNPKAKALAPGWSRLRFGWSVDVCEGVGKTTASSSSRRPAPVGRARFSNYVRRAANKPVVAPVSTSRRSVRRRRAYLQLRADVPQGSSLLIMTWLGVEGSWVQSLARVRRNLIGSTISLHRDAFGGSHASQGVRTSACTSGSCASRSAAYSE